MELSPQLTARFERLQNLYPAKRSALIPMMMYAQDEYGFVSDEMIAEIAKRLEVRTVAVEETLEYYSMLHRKPMGSDWKSGTKKSRRTACFRWRKWNASGRARARQRCRSTTISSRT
jgi:hypothetical protein